MPSKKTMPKLADIKRRQALLSPKKDDENPSADSAKVSVKLEPVSPQSKPVVLTSEKVRASRGRPKKVVAEDVQYNENSGAPMAVVKEEIVTDNPETVGTESQTVALLSEVRKRGSNEPFYFFFPMIAHRTSNIIVHIFIFRQKTNEKNTQKIGTFLCI